MCGWDLIVEAPWYLCPVWWINNTHDPNPGAFKKTVRSLHSPTGCLSNFYLRRYFSFVNRILLSCVASAIDGPLSYASKISNLLVSW